jgi:hypothetical protein
MEPVPESEQVRVRVASWKGSAWAAPVTVVESDQVMMNWADFPGVQVARDGTLFLHWLRKSGHHSYDIVVMRSPDGVSWEELGLLHDDGTQSEHGFVSWVPEGRTGVRAFWLDGRATVDKKPMQLRTARVGSEIGESQVLDDRVCDCCATDAVFTGEGPAVVYRDRDAEEVRDISMLWPKQKAASVALGPDGWQIAGCPVNGPAVSSSGGSYAVAWFTAARGEGRVQARLGKVGGVAGPPLLVARHEGDLKPLGRVDTVAFPDGSAVVSWLEAGPTHLDPSAWIRARSIDAQGRPGPVQTLAATTPDRGSGFPRLAVHQGELWVVWRDVKNDRVGLERVDPRWLGIAASEPK